MVGNLVEFLLSVRFFEILALTYGPSQGHKNYGSGPLIIWKNVSVKYAPGALF